MDVHRRSLPGQSLRFGDASVTFIVDTSSAILGYEAMIAERIQAIVEEQQDNVAGTFKYRIFGAGYGGTWIQPMAKFIGSQLITTSHTLALCDAFQTVYQDICYDDRNVIVVIRFNSSDDSIANSCERRTAHFLGHTTNQVLYVGLNHDTGVAASRYGIPRSHAIICTSPSFHEAMEACNNSIIKLRALADLYNTRRAVQVTAFDDETRLKVFPESLRTGKAFHNKIGKLDEYNNAINWNRNEIHQRFAI